jgi:putative Mg2+ transporter-C (MgtC) family protein
MLNDLSFQIIGRLLVAAACGAALGLERELQRKPSGLRTNMLIALGSALFTYSSIALAGSRGDPSRMAAQIVTGIGFLGAGAIMRHGEDSISGLTSAATVWIVAALGVLAGAGNYSLAVSGAVLALGILQVLLRLERWVLRKFAKYHLMAVFEDREGILRDVDLSLRLNGAEIRSIQISPAPDGGMQIDAEYVTTHRTHKKFLGKVAMLAGLRIINGRML